MQIHAFSTGAVKITQNWYDGGEPHSFRLMRTLFDRNFTDWLPIYVWVIEHPDGLMVIDTGIPQDANKPVWFPPHMRLIQRAAKFDIAPGGEIGPLMQSLGLPPEEVRWVVLTHLHQDHEGGLHHFPNAEFVVSRAEWEAAQGLTGRLAGYLNQRWPEWFSPALIDFNQQRFPMFEGTYTVARGVHVVPTPGHSPGHMSVIVEHNDHMLCFAGDAAYSDEHLLGDWVDGIGPDPIAQQDSHRRLQEFATRYETVFLPSHDPDAARRLAEREIILPEEAAMVSAAG